MSISSSHHHSTTTVFNIVRMIRSYRITKNLSQIPKRFHVLALLTEVAVDENVLVQELFISQSCAAKRDIDLYSVVKENSTPRFATVSTAVYHEFTVSHPKREPWRKALTDICRRRCRDRDPTQSRNDCIRNSQTQTFSCNLMAHPFASIDSPKHLPWAVIPYKGLGSGVLGITLFRLATTNLLHSQIQIVLFVALPSQLPAGPLSPSYAQPCGAGYSTQTSHLRQLDFRKPTIQQLSISTQGFVIQAFGRLLYCYWELWRERGFLTIGLKNYDRRKKTAAFGLSWYWKWRFSIRGNQWGSLGVATARSHHLAR